MDPLTTPDSREDLLWRRSRDLALEELFDEVGERYAPRLCAPHQFTVNGVRDIPDLDHLRHIVIVAHVHHMCNRRRVVSAYDHKFGTALRVLATRHEIRRPAAWPARLVGRAGDTLDREVASEARLDRKS